MKKWIIGLLSLAFIFGIGKNVSLAASEFFQNCPMNYGQAKQVMKQMHPNLSDQEIKKMYQTCHGTMGSFNSRNFQHMNQQMQQHMNDMMK